MCEYVPVQVGGCSVVRNKKERLNECDEDTAVHDVVNETLD